MLDQYTLSGQDMVTIQDFMTHCESGTEESGQQDE